MRCGIFVTLISLGVVCGDHMPKVRTKFGMHQGILSETLRGNLVANYLGIPYAKPPTDEQRFQKPAPWTKQWRRVRPATNYPKPCAVYKESETLSEDCLYMNIYTRQLEQYARSEINETDRGVLVFLISDHGDRSDNSLYSPYYLLDQDIVLVTVNYRQGVFGFFTTGDEAAPGNYGLKDVLEALHWLQENIAAFGGDPNNVTLMGHGEGAGVVHLLVLSEKSEGLFQKYVTQSGSAQSVWSYRPREKVKSASLELASATNCTHDTSKETVECLRHVPINDIEKAINELISSRPGFGPTDEPVSDDAVITKHPKILMKEGKARDIPWMTGIVANEGLPMSLRQILNRPTVCSELAEGFSSLVFEVGQSFEESVNDIPGFIESLIAFYFDGNITSSDCADNLEEMFGDIIVNWPVFETLSIQSKEMESNVYFYHFAYNGTFTITFELDSTKRYGVSHGDELNYLFPIQNEMFDDLLLGNTESDVTMINVATEMWANFVKTGVPGARLSEEWEPYQQDEGYMSFGHGATVAMKNEFLRERMIFWANLTEKYFIEPPINMIDETKNGAASLNWGTGSLKNFCLLLALLIPTIVTRCGAEVADNVYNATN